MAQSAKSKFPVTRFSIALRQHQVLKILNRYGWCTAEMVQEIAAHYGIKASKSRFYLLLSEILAILAAFRFRDFEI